MPDPTSADLGKGHYKIDAKVMAAMVETDIELRAELDALRAALAQNVAYDQRATEAAWQEVRALRARLVQTEAVVEAARADLEHDCVASPTCIEFANRPGEYSCNERDRLVLGVINALHALPEAPPAKDHVNACPCWLCRRFISLSRRPRP